MEKVRFAQIEPTTRCNFTCGFCAGRAMPQEDLTWENFQATLDLLPDLEHVELQGEGESLLHPSFFDMVEALRARKIQISFITNGSLLSERAVDRLLTAGIEKINVSIESSDADTFREIRGGKLDKVVRNLEHLMAERARRGLTRPTVGFSVTVLWRTRDARHGIYDLYKRLGLDGGITLQPLQTMPAYARHYGPEMEAQALDEIDADKVLARFFSDPTLRGIERARTHRTGFYDEMAKDWRAGSRTCPYLDHALYVHRDGAVSACCMMKHHRDGLGRIGTTALPQMLEARQELRDQLARGDVPEPCVGCSLARFAVMDRFSLLKFALRGLGDRLRGA